MKQHTSIILGLIFLFLIACEDDGLTQSDPGLPDTLQVLFIGNSLLGYNDLPGMFATFAISGEREVRRTEGIVYGRPLSWFLDNPNTLELIHSRDWTHVVLQPGPATIAYPFTHADIFPGQTYDPPGPILNAFKEIILDNHGESRIILFMPWAFADGTTWIYGQSDSYADMQEFTRQHTINIADSLDMMLVPAGWAWYRAIQGDYGLWDLFMTDYVHAVPAGSYLAAATLYAAIYQEPVQDLRYHAGLDSAMARDLRAIADSTVFDELELWNLD